MVQSLLDWSEVWALLIPLVAYSFSFHRQQPAYFKPVVVYLCGALLLNLAIDFIGDFKAYLPNWLQSNLILYAVHSLFRLVCFVYFFARLHQSHFRFFRRFLPWLYLLLITVNYLFLEDYLDKNQLSGNLFTIEAYCLLIYCLLFYLSQLRTDVESLQDDQEFWIVTGLSIYVVVNFFIFLFYVPMLRENSMLAEHMWSVHNVAYIILCLFITKALYVPVRPVY
jgi:hypothetical protein